MKAETLLAWARAFERYKGDRRYESLRGESGPELVSCSRKLLAEEVVFSEAAESALDEAAKLDEMIARNESDRVRRHLRKAYDEAVLEAAEAIFAACEPVKVEPEEERAAE